MASEAEIEAMVDRAVQRRLATDSMYLNAADAEQQAEREQAITDQEYLRVTRKLGWSVPIPGIGT